MSWSLLLWTWTTRHTAKSSYNSSPKIWSFLSGSLHLAEFSSNIMCHGKRHFPAVLFSRSYLPVRQWPKFVQPVFITWPTISYLSCLYLFNFMLFIFCLCFASFWTYACLFMSFSFFACQTVWRLLNLTLLIESANFACVHTLQKRDFTSISNKPSEFFFKSPFPHKPAIDRGLYNIYRKQLAICPPNNSRGTSFQDEHACTWYRSPRKSKSTWGRIAFEKANKVMTRAWCEQVVLI